MSDSSRRDQAQDVTDEVPSTDEKTVFDTEMLARLNALGDDDDDNDELEVRLVPLPMSRWIERSTTSTRSRVTSRACKTCGDLVRAAQPRGPGDPRRHQLID